MKWRTCLAILACFLIAGCLDYGAGEQCADGADCSRDEVCDSGACTDEEPPDCDCEIDTDCPPMNICEDCRCTEICYCESDADCGLGMLCRDCLCLPACDCMTDADCPEDSYCSELCTCEPG